MTGILQELDKVLKASFLEESAGIVFLEVLLEHPDLLNYLYNEPEIAVNLEACRNLFSTTYVFIYCRINVVVQVYLLQHVTRSPSSNTFLSAL